MHAGNVPAAVRHCANRLRAQASAAAVPHRPSVLKARGTKDTVCASNSPVVSVSVSVSVSVPVPMPACLPLCLRRSAAEFR